MKLIAGRSFTDFPDKIIEPVYLCAAYSLIALVHVVFTSGLLVPKVLSDELIYLGYAQALSGTGPLPNQTGLGFGEYGYSLFIWPAFLIGHDFFSAYRVVLAINSLLISTMIFPLYLLCRRMFDLPVRIAVLFAMIVSLYPAYVLFSGSAITENAFVPWFDLVVVLFLNLNLRKTWLAAAAFGGSVGFLFMIHGPAYGVVGVAFGSFIVLWAIRRISLASAGTGLLTLLAVFLTAQLLNHHFLLVEWHRDYDPVAGWVLSGLRSAGGWGRVALCLIGEAFYVSVCTLGLASLGFSIVYRFLWSNRSNWEVVFESRNATLLFVWLCVLATWLVGSLFSAGALPYFSSPDLPRFDFVITGRYLEATFAILMCAALSELYKNSDKYMFQWGFFAPPFVVTLVGGATIYTIFQHASVAPNADIRTNAIVFYALYRFFGSASLLSTIVFSLLASSLALAAVRRNVVLASGALAIFFVAVAAAEGRSDYYPAENGSVVSRDRPSDVLPELTATQGKHVVAYDMNYFNPFYYSIYQLEDRSGRYVQFNSAMSSGVPENAPYVIAGRAWPHGAYGKVACEPNYDSCLWASQRVGAVHALQNNRTGAPRIRPSAVQQSSELSIEGVAAQATGLYAIETNPDGRRFRWTNGDARFPIARLVGFRPRTLTVDFVAFVPTKISISIGKRLFLRTVAPVGESAKTIDVRGSGLERGGILRIQSSTFVPAKVEGFTRTLGVQIFGLSLH